MIEQTVNPEFVFALRAVTPGTPEEVRVRKLLKRLGREYQLAVSYPSPTPHHAPERKETANVKETTTRKARHAKENSAATGQDDHRPALRGVQSALATDDPRKVNQ